MNNWHTTPRFDKDWKSFTSIEIIELRKLKKLIISKPIPPDTDKWKILHQFDEIYSEGFVGALYINVNDRMVYEFNVTTKEITFTNCIGHNYRNKSYSDMEFKIRKLFAEIKPTCTTKSQKLAFNRLLNTFKFYTSK